MLGLCTISRSFRRVLTSVISGLDLSTAWGQSGFRGHSSGSPVVLTAEVESKLVHINSRFEELSNKLSGNTSLSSSQITALNKEFGEVEQVARAYQQLRQLRDELRDVSSLRDDGDAELRQLAIEEHAAIQRQLRELESSIVVLLLPVDRDDTRNVILEVRAGAGGDEAALFAADLMMMYQRYAQAQGWRFEVYEYAAASEAGGCKFAAASIAGDGVFGRLKFESGVHRVQRVPATETQGRVHTSTASVVVMPEPDEIDVTIRDADLKIDVYRSGGAGGQHVNTTDSAVRITHLPTGTVVACQDERSQHANKAKALKILRARVYEAERMRQQAAQSADRRGAIGSGDRNERIRTYNYPQSRITDHRLGLTEHGMPEMMLGMRLDAFIEGLLVQQQVQLMAQVAGNGPGAKE